MLFSFACCATSEPCKSDTIIIDGKTLVIERVVEYREPGSDSIPEPKDPKKDRVRTPSYWRFEALAGTSLFQEQGVDLQYQTLNSFVGKPGTIRPGGGVNILKGWQIAEDYEVEIGVGMSLSSLRNQHFAESQLDDSLWRFQSLESGQLDQILRYDFGFGSELDTLALELQASNFTQLTVEIPIRFGYTWNLDRRQQSLLAVKGGASLLLSQDLNGGPIVLLNEEGDYLYVSDLEITAPSTRVSALLMLEYRMRMGYQLPTWASFGVYFSPVLSPEFNDNDFVNYHSMRFGFVASLNIFSKANRNKTAQFASGK